MKNTQALEGPLEFLLLEGRGSALQVWMFQPGEALSDRQVQPR